MNFPATAIRSKPSNRAAFEPSGEGQAAGHLRAAFNDLVAAYVHGDAMTVTMHASLWALCGRLWNCGDLLPWFVFCDFEEMAGMHDVPPLDYAGGARFMRWHMRANKPRLRVPVIMKTVQPRESLS
ncbi:hypothetical protein H9Q09_04960 [Aurantimonas sp. DM33-3]|uniref:hypothetical protein n=1 Tax=Aurantimonas sp. DM33-3 TaxID=2766955 RepID=UPI001651DF22|nr:hypothetical protein [Aurantimonas sp. DM33-3]MBC6715542.1 hypothetical protein [Aurantimonas sp. DM33-3]